MTELAIREALVFGGAVAGAFWGYFLGKAIERGRLAREVRPSLEALERWAMQVCDGLEGLERSLGVVQADVLKRPSVREAPPGAPPPQTRPVPAVRRLVSRLRTAP